MRDLFIIDADEDGLDPLDLGIKYKAPDQDDIYRLLWGVSPGDTISPTELEPATIGDIVDDNSN